MLKIIKIILMFMVSFATSAASDWQLVLKHDKQGKVLEGSKSNLVQHIKEGRPIRIVWPLRPNFIHIMDAGFLSVMDEEVFAQPAPITRQMPNFKDTVIALDAVGKSKWTAIFSSTGRLESFQSTESKSKVYQFALEWYSFIPTTSD